MPALQKQKLSDEQDMYKNEARKKGEVDVELPKDLTDLSTVHTPIGGLFESPKVQLIDTVILAYFITKWMPLTGIQCDFM